MADSPYVRKRQNRSAADFIKAPLAFLMVLFACAAFYVFIALPPEPRRVQNVSAATAVALGETSAVLGDPNASARFFLYCDLTTPDCARFHSELLPELREKYISSNKVAFVFVNTPRTRDPRGIEPRRAAAAFMCAKNQGKTWEMFDQLLGNQNEWRTQRGAQADPFFEKYAQEIGVNMTQFKSCIAPDNKETQAQIDADIQAAKDAGANVLYGFRINQRPAFAGFRSFDFIEDLIEDELR